MWATACEKRLRNMRTINAQISLRIRAVWSGLSLSAKRIIGYQRLSMEIICPGETLRMRWMNPCILRMLEDTFLLGAAHVRMLKRYMYQLTFFKRTSFAIMPLNSNSSRSALDFMSCIVSAKWFPQTKYKKKRNNQKWFCNIYDVVYSVFNGI